MVEAFIISYHKSMKIIMPISSLIRVVPNYPRDGIMFRDITTLLKDAVAFHTAIDEIALRYRDVGIDKVVGIESRGFIIGAPVAFQLQKGFVPIRKQNKLPAETIGRNYQLEYGSDRIEIHIDAIQPGERVLLVDDLIATGGTAEAAVGLIHDMGGEVVECCFVIDLPDVGGRMRLTNMGCKVFSLCEFSGS
ncbi:adenine phosphoribosyltransferase [Nitrosomonas sp. PY1]|nr:adenine phosphoribosyltransferase [Nitrosomonas sp. PY1]